MSAPVAHILNADNLGGDGVVETIAEGEVVIGGSSQILSNCS